ncbi:MAG TPA: TIGR01777 family oxidoreductase [Bryobacteraceae bacterium]|nr:TIGR01777 family oxidoreductase [Bryobacteraceae bacterium]
MNIALTGSSGFMGRALTARLETGGHRVLPLRLREAPAVPPCDAVVHLAGEPIAQRWTAAAKQRIRESRVEATRALVAQLAKLERTPRVLVAASAIGIYGSRGDEVLTEASAPGSDFLAELCVAWEQAAREAAAFGVRVVSVRFGIVLGREGGALARMLLPFRLGVGGRLGSGRQWMSWIHLEDALGLVEFALGADRVSGPLNATAPNPVTNAEFTRRLAAALHRPAFTPAPAFALKLMFGEMAGMLLDSQRVEPHAALAAGYAFRYPDLGPALRRLLA